MQNADFILIPLLNGSSSLAQVDRGEGDTERLFLSAQTATPDTLPKRLLPHGDDTPQDPAIAEASANAIHGHYPWDGFSDPAFFTSFLRDPATLADRARLTADFPKPDTP